MKWFATLLTLQHLAHTFCIPLSPYQYQFAAVEIEVCLNLILSVSEALFQFSLICNLFFP